jgi:hypothetical protein
MVKENCPEKKNITFFPKLSEIQRAIINNVMIDTSKLGRGSRPSPRAEMLIRW